MVATGESQLSHMPARSSSAGGCHSRNVDSRTGKTHTTNHGAASQHSKTVENTFDEGETRRRIGTHPKRRIERFQENTQRGVETVQDSTFETMETCRCNDACSESSRTFSVARLFSSRACGESLLLNARKVIAKVVQVSRSGDARVHERSDSGFIIVRRRDQIRGEMDGFVVERCLGEPVRGGRGRARSR